MTHMWGVWPGQMYVVANSVRPYLIDFMFRGSGGSDFCSLQKKKKKVGALLRMRTSTKLRRRDAALLEEEN